MEKEKRLIQEKIVDDIKIVVVDMLEAVVKIADKYGEDRDELLDRVGIVVQTMAEQVNFKNYMTKDGEVENKSQTRLERIQTMNVEELADEIMRRSEISTAIDFCQKFEEGCETIPESECRECLIKWLNSSEQKVAAIPTEHFQKRFNRVN